MNYNKLIDHTVLKADTKLETVKKICDEAKQYDFASVCINPTHVAFCANELKGTDVKVCTVIGFPLGANTSAVKAFETKDAINNGADEIDMVMNIGALKEKDYDYVKKEIEYIRDAIDGKTLKVIIETSVLTDEEIIEATKICNECFINFVKTSTGFFGGATEAAVKLIKDNISEVVEIKVSGGIKTEEDAIKYIEMGATRIGTSCGKKIIDHCCCDDCCCEDK